MNTMRNRDKTENATTNLLQKRSEENDKASKTGREIKTCE